MKVLLISNMYPNEKFPSFGVFVKNFIDLAQQENITIKKIVLTKETNKFKKLFAYLMYYFSIFTSILFSKYDTVYVHYAGPNAVPLYYLQKIKKFPLILNIHGSDVFPDTEAHKKYLKYTRSVLPKCNTIVVPSQYFKEYVIKNFEVNEANIKIFPSSGINPALFYPQNKEECRRNIQVDTHKHTVGYISRIDEGKGWDILLKAIRLLHQNKSISPKTHQFIFVGSGGKIDAFNTLAAPIKEYLVTIPTVAQKDLGSYYNAFDVFCFPTYRESESLGLVAIEALGCGTPVIATDYAAPKYYIEDHYNGYKFHYKSEEDLANKIMQFFALSNQERQQLEENALLSSKPFHTTNLSESLLHLFK